MSTIAEQTAAFLDDVCNALTDMGWSESPVTVTIALAGNPALGVLVLAANPVLPNYDGDPR